ncbi:thioesterase domain-containing protein [Bacillus cereus]|uniref:Thioesterase n=1 Tax=Bacillus cereus TaxID=1396 RepID=A0ABD7DP25_BACCE|nr:MULTISPECIES: alpha/beta fold hydrolase [Bacillus cereus group]MCU4937348.1 thioesterase domain-containing protein [Bacillus cereus]MCU5457577.1 thioesterase domain-containing protein [Bacillus cereus]MCU5503075.1 thioesterase domain-containing protein [Bacillus cereus]MCU5510495.1 thioesterase domain-containing protein [Bacillus cereus]MCU5551059.1 thioesterase domain-containing protein [Bacillus cereus]
MEKMRLLCLPYAGGSAASIYLPWKRKLKEEVEVIPLELAGRGKRIKEPLLQSVDEMVTDLIEKTSLILSEGEERPYAIFGHSMGGLLAYQFCRKINELNLPQPSNLIVSGFQPPDIKLKGDIHILPIDEFAKKMAQTGNIPVSIFKDSNLYNLFIPILYCDYKAVFNYEYQPADSIKTDLHIFTGKNDYPVYHLRKEWSRHTDEKFEVHVFEGGHFFIREDELEVLNRIKSILSSNKFLEQS